VSVQPGTRLAQVLARATAILSALRIRSLGDARTPRSLLALALVLLLVPAAVPADSPVSLPITINANARNHRVADKIGKICTAEVPRIAGELGLTRLEPIQIDVIDDVAPYNRAHGGHLPEWGIAFAMLEENRIIVDVKRATREFNSLDEVVPHELSHLLVHQRAPDVRFPLWFLEGLAQWQAREWSLVDQWELVQGVWTHTSPRLIDMYGQYPVDESRAQQAYRVAYAGFVDLFAEVGFDDLAPFLAEAERQHSFENGFHDYFGYSVAEYQAFFQNDFEKKYGSAWMALQSGPLLAFAAGLFLVVILRYLIRRRRKFARLDD
jgi:hypothetical protein